MKKTKLTLIIMALFGVSGLMAQVCGPNETLYSYCYDSGESDNVAFEICSNGVAFGNIVQGTFESSFDDLTVYEGAPGSGTTGVVVFGPQDGNLAGTNITAANPGTCLIFVVNSDASVSCVSGSQTELQVCGTAAYCDQAQLGAGFSPDANCEAAVCAIDAFCCSVGWDGICADEAATLVECCGCLQAPTSAECCLDLDCPGGSVVPCADYVIDNTVAFNYIDITNTGALIVTGDDVIGTATLGAPWTFYGEMLTELGLGTNGYISSLTGDSGGDLSNDCPINGNYSTGNDAANRIMALHDDYECDPGQDADAGMYYQYFAASPYAHPSGFAYGAHVIQYVGDHFNATGNADVEWEAILFDNGDFVLQYLNDPENGSSSTVGVTTGSLSTAACAPSSTQLYCNTGGAHPSNSAVGFSPYGGPLSQSPPPGAGQTVSTDPGVCGADVVLDVTATALCGAIVSEEYSLTGATSGSGPYTGSVFLNLGTTIVTYTVTMADGTSTSCTFDVTVVDDLGPTFTGCNDIIVDLGPGECDAQVSWNVSAEDNCPIGGGGNSLTTTNLQDQLQGQAGVMFEMENVGGQAVQLTDFDILLDAGAWTIQMYYTTSSDTYLGIINNGVAGASNADWTYVGQFAANSAGVGSTTNIPLGGLTLQPGDQKGIYITATASIAGGPISYEINGPSPATANNGTLETRAGIGLTNLDGAGFGNDAGGVIFGDAVSPPPTGNYRLIEARFNYMPLGNDMGLAMQTDGLASGVIYPVGTTTNCFIATDAVGNTSTCCFDVTVNEYNGPVNTSLACNDNVQISVDQDCNAFVGPDDILEGGPYACYDEYLVTVENNGSGLGGVQISNAAVGQVLNVTITDPNTGNSCWGTITVEDKIDPILECTDITVTCGESTDPFFGTPASGVQTFSVSPGLPVGPDGGSVTTSDLVVGGLPQGAVVTDVNLYLNLTHSFVGDLTIDLTAPDGSVIGIWANNCTNQPTGFDITFDDESANTPQTFLCTDLDDGLDVQLNGITPSFMSDADGGSAAGVWNLTATDAFNLDGGTLNQWSLTISYIQVLPTAPTVTENCDLASLDWDDAESGDDCTGGAILRTWTATDASGNTGTCLQTISIDPLTLDALVCPGNYTGECGGSTDPSVTGYPTVNGSPIVVGGTCNIFAGYEDLELDDCGNGSKIVRTWTVLDWCTQETAQCVQIIKLTDNQGPVLDCPNDITVSSDPWFCEADVNIDYPDAYDACGTSFDLSVSSSAGTIVPFGSFYRVDNLPLGTHTITWTATDACGNEGTCSYTITVQDHIPPVPLCDEHTIVSLTIDDLLNEGLTKIPATVFDDGSYDNCTPVSFLARRMNSCINFDWIGPAPLYGEFPNSDGIVTSLDRGQTPQPLVPFACCDLGAGPIMVELTVFDENGNSNTCMVEVEVQDKLRPFMECPPDIIVSCDFWFDVQETNGFVDQSADVTTPIFGRVLDAYDYDQSDRQAIIIDDPGNDDPNYPQPYQWGIDGWADDNCDVDITVRVRIFDDCSGDALPGVPPSPYTVRLVERTFRADDGNTQPRTCAQRIWVVDFDPFYISDQTCVNSDPNDGVIWPCDETITICPDELTVNYPTIFDDNCSLIGVTYEDTRFDFVDGACYKILREWTIIDWCQYDANTGAGLWDHIQVIKVIDSQGAAFEDCPAGPVTLCVANENVYLPSNNQVFLGENNPNSSSCSAHVIMERVVTETCSDYVLYDVKLYPFNGTDYIQVVSNTQVDLDTNNQATLTFSSEFASLPSNHPIRRYGVPYNSNVCSNWPFPGGEKDYHRILWSVEDGCGNLNTCEYLFRLEDCKQPSPVCVGLSSVVMPTSGEVTIWAADFNASSFDDCTPADELLYSFSGDVYQPSRSFDCAAIEANGSPSFIVEIWVGDNGNDQNCNGFIQPLGIEWSERNKDFCTTFIVIDDNEGVCGTGGSAGGVIETEEIEPVELVTVTLKNTNGDIMQSFTTNDDGIYHFINPLLDYEITADRNDDHKNGVSTLDLVKIQKHLLGIESLSSPYKLIAADANNSESVSAIDLVEIRKLILGIYTEFPNNESWRFVDEDYTFADASNPWPFDEVIDPIQITMGNDFVGVKVGDVNGTVAANANSVETRNAVGSLLFATADQDVTVGEAVAVPVSADNFNDILGYQFTLRTEGLTLTNVEAGAIDMTTENVGVHHSAITASWHKAAAVSADDVLFTLHFTATQSGQLSEMLSMGSRVTAAEAYTSSEELLDVALTFTNGTVVPATGKEYALFQNAPNPFKGETVVSFTLPEAMEATLTVFDVTGKVVHVVEGDYAAGYNEVTLAQKQLSATGVLYYRLDADDFTATKKMVIID